MNIKPINNTSFGIYQNTLKKVYSSNCYTLRDTGSYRGYNIIISNNYLNNKLFSRLYVVHDSAKNYIKSKLKYFSNNKAWKELRGGKG